MMQLVGIIIGIVCGIVIPYQIPSAVMPFVAMGLLAACNTLFGGIAAQICHKFDYRTFVIGFFFNTAMAAVLTWAGTKLGFDFSLAAIVYFGTRIFNNLAKIQHSILQKHENRVKIKVLANQRTKALQQYNHSDGETPKTGQVIDNGGRHDGI